LNSCSDRRVPRRATNTQQQYVAIYLPVAPYAPVQDMSLRKVFVFIPKTANWLAASCVQLQLEIFMTTSNEEGVDLGNVGGRFSMPMDQRNAYLKDELVMRVGIPHKGGHLAFHAFQESYSAMVSASAFWHQASQTFKIPEATNLSELDLALDSAGYTAMSMWKQKGTQKGMAGVFPWGYAQYTELAALLSVNWWAQPDMCCEPQLASNQDEIDYRIDATATLLEGTLRVVYAWQNELAKDGQVSEQTIKNMIKPPVPVVQGWSASDYMRSIELLMAVWERWQPWLAAPTLIGVGSVCRRSLKHPTNGLHAILAALEGNIPSGSRLHMFGVKGACLSDLKMLDWIASADSMAYDMGARMKALKSGHSNSMVHRSSEMTQWMKAAGDRIRPAAGDQFRLGLFA